MKTKQPEGIVERWRKAGEKYIRGNSDGYLGGDRYVLKMKDWLYFGECFLTKALQSQADKTREDTLREVEELLPYGAGFTDRLYKLKKI